MRSAEEEGKEEQPELHLFEAKGLRHPEFWQCIRYIAPSNEKKKWKSTDSKGKSRS